MFCMLYHPREMATLKHMPKPWWIRIFALTWEGRQAVQWHRLWGGCQRAMVNSGVGQHSALCLHHERIHQQSNETKQRPFRDPVREEGVFLWGGGTSECFFLGEQGVLTNTPHSWVAPISLFSRENTPEFTKIPRFSRTDSRIGFPWNSSPKLRRAHYGPIPV